MILSETHITGGKGEGAIAFENVGQCLTRKCDPFVENIYYITIHQNKGQKMEQRIDLFRGKRTKRVLLC